MPRRKEKTQTETETESPDKGVPDIPSSLLHVLLATRTSAVLFSNIWDCDETYNYFEPAHFLLYGFGCQTWEYAPSFALRSYAYLLFHLSAVCIPAIVFSASKVFIFYFIRFFLVMLEFWSQRKLARAISDHFGSPIAGMSLLMAAFSPGYFQASTSFLPSSTAMVLVQYAMATFIKKEYLSTALAGAISAFLVWPFSAALYAPAAIAILVDLKMKSVSFALKLIFWALFLVVIPVVLIDSIFYGKFVAAAYNIFVYNFVTVDETRGSHLYGTAPLSFYLMNLFLNFNFALVFLCIGVVSLLIAPKNYFTCVDYTDKSKSTWRCRLVFVSTLLVWLGIFLPQPHKEERFLYPVYPLICFTAAVGIHCITTVIYKAFQASTRLCNIIADSVHLGFIVTFAILSVSRCAALYFNYHASMDIYLRFSESVKLPTITKGSTFNFCVGREWHRSPGHFLLNDNRLRLRFIESAFEGLLPGHYFENMSIANATRAERFDMNDLNREEKTRYIPASSCHFLVDVNMESIGNKPEKEPNYVADSSGNWSVLVKLPYLAHIDREDITVPGWQTITKRLLRAFYVPYFSSVVTSSSFRDYVVLQNTALLPLKVSSTLMS